MIDEDFGVNLIEVNTNPCLETNCPILSRLIPRLLDNAFKIAIDPLFPPADLNFKRGSEAISNNHFKLIFDDSLEKHHFEKLDLKADRDSSTSSLETPLPK
jgi:tubulin---tyrosine ligase